MFWDKANKKQEREIRSQLAEKQQLYQRVFATSDGQLVLDDLKKRCFVDTTTADDNPYRTYLNEGRRSVYAYITQTLDKDLESLLSELTKEQ